MQEGLPIDENNFPDPEFRAYIKKYFDNDKNDYLSDSERLAVKNIKVSESFYNAEDLITNFKGLEHFPSLETFNCSYNEVATLDLSQNPALTTLICNENILTSLTVSNNPNLKILECANNQLTELNISNNSQLTELQCYNNQLTTLDLTNNPNLTRVDCYYNQLTTLALDNLSVLNRLACSHNKLTALDLSDTTNLVTLDCDSNLLTNLILDSLASLTWLSCAHNNLSELDVTSNITLEELYCSGNDLQQLNLANNASLVYLSCERNNLTSLDLTPLANLTWVSCAQNNIAALDLSQNIQLSWLNCSQNKLEQLELTTNTALSGIECDNNRLTSLDLNPTTCGWLKCQNNQYEISIEENRTFDLSTLPGQFDPNKTSAWIGGSIEGNWLTVDPTVRTVQYTYDIGKNKSADFALSIIPDEPIQLIVAIDAEHFPDTNFRTYVVENFDVDSDGYLSDVEINSVQEVSVPNANISSLQGIEYFTSLKSLDCSDNQLTTLDLNLNTALETLNCSANNLTSLDLSNQGSELALLCENNSYRMESDYEGVFDLLQLPGSFDPDKASNWTGGTVDGSTLVFDPDVVEVTFDYAVSPHHTAVFQLENLTVVITYITVSFDCDGGSPVTDQVYARGLSAQVPTPPTKTGYIFKEWQYNGLPFDFSTPVFESIELKAVWDIEPPLPVVQDIQVRALASHTVDLTWQDVTSENSSDGSAIPIDGYLVYRKNKDEPLTLCAAVKEPYCLDENASVDEANFYFIFTYRKRSDGSLQISQPSSYVYCIPTSRDTIKTVQNVQARAVGLNSVHLSWDSVDNVDGYMIFRKLANGELEYVYLTPNTRFTDLQAYRDQYNFYFIFGYRTSWGGKHITASPSHYVYARPGLADVKHLTAAQKNNRVVLTWQSVPFADGYVIYRKEDGQTTLDYMYMIDANHTRWTDVNPIRGKVNYYFVTPYFKEGDTMHIKPVKPYTYSIVPK